MIVITISNCPPRLRGDLSKWLFEIDTGVFVGSVSARIREHLWDRICENIDGGRASMVYGAQNEQHMEFRVHNSPWKPIELDGLTLIKRPLPAARHNAYKDAREQDHGFSNAAKMLMGKRHKMKGDKEGVKYAFLDIETTGLDKENDEIIEIGVVCTDEKTITERWSAVVIPNKNIPETVTELTGIDKDTVNAEGIPLEKAMHILRDKLRGRVTVIYNAAFDMAFLRRAESISGCALNFGKVVDALSLARKRMDDMPDYKLGTVAECLGIETDGRHRAAEDCEILCRVYFKLNEI